VAGERKGDRRAAGTLRDSYPPRARGNGLGGRWSPQQQIAHDIGISEITVKVHRGQVMRKMKAASLPDLARMADKLNFTGEKSQSC